MVNVKTHMRRTKKGQTRVKAHTRYYQKIYGYGVNLRGKYGLMQVGQVEVSPKQYSQLEKKCRFKETVPKTFITLKKEYPKVMSKVPIGMEKEFLRDVGDCLVSYNPNRETFYLAKGLMDVANKYGMASRKITEKDVSGYDTADISWRLNKRDFIMLLDDVIDTATKKTKVKK